MARVKFKDPYQGFPITVLSRYQDEVGMVMRYIPDDPNDPRFGFEGRRKQMRRKGSRLQRVTQDGDEIEVRWIL